MACSKETDEVKSKLMPKTCSMTVTPAGTTDHMKQLRTDHVKLLKTAVP